jgi:hypothetical protein
MKYLIKVFDVVEGKVIAVVSVGSLCGRTFKAAMHRAGVTTNGMCKDRDVITYVSDECLSHEQKVALAKLMKDWQAEEDTIEYGIEWQLFHNVYLSVDERAMLHAGELKFNEMKLQADMTDAERKLANDVHDLRYEQKGVA